MAKLTYDLHLHSCLSPCGDNDMTPTMIVGMAKVIGLDVVALTDHNSARNCPAFMKAGEAYGVTTIPGMELTTMEEVHVLCYFRNLEDALAFSDYVHEHILPVPNRPEIFGDEIIVDEDENRIGKEDILLISATDIPFEQAYDLVAKFNGVMVPAHINKQTTSLLSNLGFIPQDSKFQCVEVKNPKDVPELVEKNPYLKDCLVLSSSDAHTLNDIQEPIRYLECNGSSIDQVMDVIERKAGN